MSSFFTFIGSLLRSLWLRLTAPAPPPVVAPAPSRPLTSQQAQANLASIALSSSVDLGPMPTTGGIIHAIDAAIADEIAALAVRYASQYGIKLSILASYLYQESRFDPNAVNPNKQLAKPGESELDAFRHTDSGLGQLDGETLLGMPELQGQSLAEIEATAYNPDWALNTMCSIIAANATQIAAAVQADAALQKAVFDYAGNDLRVVQANAYNEGDEGTLDALRAATASGPANLAYGKEVVERADKWAAVLDVP